MAMPEALQTSMCKGLRACGLDKPTTYAILGAIQKWYNSCGPEWTNDRIKALKQWYESTLAGHPEPPEWFRHSRSGLPLGVWGRVFRFRNPAKVLAVLSANTVMVHRGSAPLPSQESKFESSINGGTLSDAELQEGFDTIGTLEPDGMQVTASNYAPSTTMSPASIRALNRIEQVYDLLDPEKLLPPTPEYMRKHVPVEGGQRTRSTATKQERAAALAHSWASLPQSTYDFIEAMSDWDESKLSWIPFLDDSDLIGLSVSGNAVTDVVGRIACLQQPGLKARWIGNPHRITQYCTEPLGSVLALLDDADPCTCTRDQEAGVRWAQQKLREDVTLAGADMTSASDLLSLGHSLRAATSILGSWVLSGRLNASSLDGFSDPAHIITRTKFDARVQKALGELQELWFLHLRHFVDVSRAPWVIPRSYRMADTATWRQGWCLGTRPSFPLLSLTNSAMARDAAYKAGLNPRDSYRVIGDDIIMDARILDAYVKNVEELGGLINHSKTLTSDRVAEFAGRIIFPNRVCRKTYKYRDPGDNSFMEYVSDLGPKALGMLRSRQRRMWDEFRFIPGVAIDGPWDQNSYGEPLDKRLGWALTEVSVLGHEGLEADKREESVEAGYLYTQLVSPAVQVLGKDVPVNQVLPDPDEPHADYLSAAATVRAQTGDPRLVEGKTLLQRLESEAQRANRVPYRQYAKQKDSDSASHSSLGEDVETLPTGSNMVDGIPSPSPTDAAAHRSPDSESKDWKSQVVVSAPRDDPEEESDYSPDLERG